MAATASFPLSALMGSWYLSYSTLNMWKSGGKRSNPHVVFADLSDKEGVVSWSDTLVFDQKALFGSKVSSVTIAGSDTVTGSDPLTFRWSGKGWLGCLSSNCKLLVNDPTFEEYAILHFSATWFSEEGIDLLTRNPEGLAPERLKEVLATLDPAMQQFVEDKGLSWTQIVPAPATAP